MIDVSEPPAETKPEVSPNERLAAWILGGPLALFLGGLMAWELITWAPNYLTWPLWADHDVFATAARAWHGGMLPYRDFRGNNFPGTIYVFYVLGRYFGWGRPAPFYAFDVSTVVVLGLSMLTWSRRRFGSRLPGLIGFGCFLGYYLNLDYSQAAQRDWHGPFFVVAGTLLAQGWPGRTSRMAAGLLSAIGLVFRPQAILLLPSQALAVGMEARRAGRSAVAALVEWGLAGVVGLALGFSPLILAGLWPDFLRALQVVRPGGSYNMFTPRQFIDQMCYQMMPMRIAAVPLALLLLSPCAARSTCRASQPWMVALAFVLLYRPLSPVPHAYLTHPLMLVWAIMVALLAEVILEQGRLSATTRLAAILLLIGLGVTAKPRFCNPGRSVSALSILKKGKEPGQAPSGYVLSADVPSAAKYKWSDYRELLDYLRNGLGPETRVANALKHVPAVTGPAGRLSAFPAESIAWLLIVRRDREEEEVFIKTLLAAEDSVVVWYPGEEELPHVPKLTALYGAITVRYEPARRFGPIEVWARKPAVTSEVAR